MKLTRSLRASHRRYRAGVAVLAACMSLLFTATAARADRQRVTITNGVLNVTIDLPDAVNGVYRGTRFDWSGVIEQLTYGGHVYYGRWFTQTDPSVHDFVFAGNQIVAGPCSAITGPAEEFLSGNAALGYNEAAPGQTFVKIGVGALLKPDEAKYDSFHLYKIVNGGEWTVGIHSDSVEFRQRLIDSATGYGYIYQKTIRLVPGQSVMEIEHSLRNTGKRVIDTDVYDHNFLVLDHRTTGPDFVITLPFAIQTPKPVKSDLGAIDGNQIRYRKELEGREVFSTPIRGFGPTAKDYDIRIDNAQAGVGMRITADRRLAKEELWSIRTIIGMEPFLHMTIAPGHIFRWRYRYQYYAMPTH